jgi:hypothetical protein
MDSGFRRNDAKTRRGTPTEQVVGRLFEFLPSLASAFRRAASSSRRKPGSIFPAARCQEAMLAYKSAHSGLAASINAIFQLRRHSFSCFSRVIAASALSSISK